MPHEFISQLFRWTGSLLLVVGILWMLLMIVRQATWEQAAGTVVDLKVKKDGIDTYEYPIVTFRTAVGDDVTFTATCGHGCDTPAQQANRPFVIGQEISVRHHPHKPGSAYIDSFTTTWGGPVVFLLFGGMFCLAASLQL